MQPALIDFALNRIQQEWNCLETRPWGVWIGQYTPVPEPFTDSLNSWSSLQRAWFLSGSGLNPRSVQDYWRMMVLHWEKPWCSKTDRERTFWSITGGFEIGFASFAQYDNSGDLYLELQWGGLHGRGWRLEMQVDCVLIQSRALWVS
jgi:hypothetical protein